MKISGQYKNLVTIVKIIVCVQMFLMYMIHCVELKDLHFPQTFFKSFTRWNYTSTAFVLSLFSCFSYTWTQMCGMS